MIAWMKVVHIVGIAFWCAGLLALPSLYARRSMQCSPRTLSRLHHATRFVFINVTSPAAVLAIATGIALLFLREAFTAWMVLKLAVVGLLVMIHFWSSHTIIHVFDPGRRFTRWQHVTMICVTIVAVTAILYLVLEKPEGDMGMPLGLTPSGTVQSSSEIMIPTP